MNTLEAIAKRKSTRAYKPEQISEQVLAAIQPTKEHKINVNRV